MCLDEMKACCWGTEVLEYRKEMVMDECKVRRSIRRELMVRMRMILKNSCKEYCDKYG